MSQAAKQTLAEDPDLYTGTENDEERAVRRELLEELARRSRHGRTP